MAQRPDPGIERRVAVEGLLLVLGIVLDDAADGLLGETDDVVGDMLRAEAGVQLQERHGGRLVVLAGDHPEPVHRDLELTERDGILHAGRRTVRQTDEETPAREDVMPELMSEDIGHLLHGEALDRP